MMKKLLAIVCSLVLLIGITPSPASAYVYWGLRYEAADIGDKALTMCFEANTFVDTHRTDILQGFLEWNWQWNTISFVDHGDCDVGRNVMVYANDPLYPNAICGFSPNARVEVINSTVKKMYFNKGCEANGWFWWGNTGSPDTGGPFGHGVQSGRSIAAHEMGHAYGLGHTTNNGYMNLMDATDTQTALCTNDPGWAWNGQVMTIYSHDDWHGIEARYLDILPAGAGVNNSNMLCAT